MHVVKQSKLERGLVMAEEIRKLAGQTFISDDVNNDCDMALRVENQYGCDIYYVDEIISEFNIISERLLSSIINILTELDKKEPAAEEGE